MQVSIVGNTEKAVLSSSILGHKCFLCGDDPSSGRGEHVVPLWLQQEFELLNQKLTLLNGTLIPYRQLTIPCCVECNTGVLSGLERQVQAIAAKAEISDHYDAMECARWMAKILIGIIIKETGLLFDRSAPHRGKIVPAEMIEELKHCHLLLQSARKTLQFHGLHGTPFSFYWYRIDQSAHGSAFDLSTNVVGQSVAVRFGKIGMAFINDGGMQLEFSPDGPLDANGKVVTPAQFSELAARIHYKSGLRDATHVYLHDETDEKLVLTQQSVQPFSSVTFPNGEIQIYEKWDAGDFALFASQITGLPREAFIDDATGNGRTSLGNLMKEEELVPGSAIVVHPVKAVKNS